MLCAHSICAGWSRRTNCHANERNRGGGVRQHRRLRGVDPRAPADHLLEDVVLRRGGDPLRVEALLLRHGLMASITEATALMVSPAPMRWRSMPSKATSKSVWQPMLDSPLEVEPLTASTPLGYSQFTYGPGTDNRRPLFGANVKFKTSQ